MKSCFQHLDRIEFVMTYACTGHCKHCSEGDHTGCTEHIDGDIAARTVRTLCEHYPIRSLMTFGGEPLLYPEDVCKIHQTAKEMGIPKRHIITNGFFSRDPIRIRDVAHALVKSGITKIMQPPIRLRGGTLMKNRFSFSVQTVSDYTEKVYQPQSVQIHLLL